MGIQFTSHRIKFKPEKEKKRIEWLNKVANSEGCNLVNLEYVFCSDNFLLKINQDYLQHNTLTDIITFDYCSDLPKLNKKPQILGEIYISVPRVKENARLFKSSFNQELNRVLVHGLLHLCGYKDKTPAQEKAMRVKEDEKLLLY